jgi:hypothetical protein
MCHDDVAPTSNTATRETAVTDWDLAPGDYIKRTELHARFGGGGQGGLSPCAKSPNVLIFSDPLSGSRHGYIYDKWDEADSTLFHFTGEGQTGDQQMKAGNAAVLNSASDGRALRVFKGVRGIVRYIDQFKLDRLPFEIKPAPATGNGPTRQVIVFGLRRMTDATERLARRPRATAAPTYRRADPSPTQQSEQPFTRDPTVIDRALRAHADTQNSLSDFLTSSGAITWSPQPAEPDFDLAWTFRGVTFVGEVKSLTAINEDRQLRLGLGQVLDYQALMARETTAVRAVLVVEHQPQDARWLALCERHNVVLVWPATFPVLLESELTA